MQNRLLLPLIGGVIVAFLLGYCVGLNGLFTPQIENPSPQPVVMAPENLNVKSNTKDQQKNEERFREVSFCGKVYKVEGDNLVINNIDVVDKIAEIATLHPEDYVCNNIETNTPDGILDIEVTKQPLNDSDYKPNTYFIRLKSMFRVSGNIIYKVGGFDGTLYPYGNLR